MLQFFQWPVKHFFCIVPITMRKKKAMVSSVSGTRAIRRAGLTQASALRQTRLAHAREIAEDYAEAIADLIETRGEARIVDIASRLGVSHVTVVRTVARLQRNGLVTTEPYRAIFLTEKGLHMARESHDRHETVISFLRRLGVSDEAARTDAEGIEHHVSPETLAAFAKFLRQSFRRQ
jgi:DtxR family manganese transport transcriptional regulator